MAKAANRLKSTALYETILQLKTVDECRAFFRDLCTPGELQALEQRFEVALLLDEGLVYTSILERTGASSATISRANRVMTYGTGAFADMIRRRKEVINPKEKQEKANIRGKAGKT